MTKMPLAIDLFCGLFGWSDGLTAEGFRVVGFDLEDMCAQFGVHRPANCQLVIQDVRTLHGSQFRDAALIVASPPCQFFSYCAMPWSKSKALAAKVRAQPDLLAEKLALFNACFRIQREACEAAGRHIPLVVENVRGAQPWVGRARFNVGSFYFWGTDVPALMPPSVRAAKVPGFRFDGSGRSFQSASVEGVKVVKDGLGGYGGNFGWDGSPLRRGNSKSSARKFASAMIAKIPLALSRHIAATYHPRQFERAP